MITIRMSGGLGNQMFQYALGRALSEKNGVGLALDLSGFDRPLPGETPREFLLDRFNIVAKTIKLGLFGKLERGVRRRLELNKPLAKKTVILEPSFAVTPEISDVKDGVYLAGVWQSEKYFKPVADKIRAELTLKAPLSQPAQEVLNEIALEKDPVSVHVRRGDQVNNPKLLEKHGALTYEYYNAAINYVKGRVGASRLFVFSDEIDWVRDNLGLGPGAKFVSALGLPDYEEIVLMSKCKHNITAKSSFSWWGAWLNVNPDKIVIAPKNRFGAESNGARDHYPSGWVPL